MKTSTLLKVLIVAEWIAIAVGIALSFALRSELPPELGDWLERQSGSDPTLSDWIIVGIGMPLLVLAFVSSVGLFLLRQWGARLYLITTILGTLLMAFDRPSVTHSFENLFSEFSLVVSGIIIGIAFFTDVLQSREVPNQALHGSTESRASTTSSAP